LEIPHFDSSVARSKSFGGKCWVLIGFILFEEPEKNFHVDTSAGSTPKSLLFFILLLAVSSVVIKNQISIDRTLTHSKVY